jgi:trans-aconitate methyltransferase
MARDTSVDWESIGETEPWFGVLSAPEFLQKNLTEATKNKFYDQGRQEMAEVMDTLRTHFPPFEPKVGADFGSGLGRLTFPMSTQCETVYGIDLARGMREEAGRQAEARGFANVSFVPALPGDVSVDWINSYIVLQHILPRTGYELLKNLLATLNVRGHVSIQVTYAHDIRDTSTLLRDILSWRFDGETMTTIEEQGYAPGQMSMYDYDMNKVLMLAARAGIRELFLRHTDHGGVHGFWIFGRKTH